MMTASDIPLRVAITGASGMIGTHVAAALRAEGKTVYPLKRKETIEKGHPAPASVWETGTGVIRTPEPIGAIVHLAGKNIATRWTKAVRKELWKSRIPPTEKLCRYLAGMPDEERPRVLVSASAIGIYGNRGEELLTEESAAAREGESYLADICRAWEAATLAAQEAGIRVVHVRIGVVLSKEDGALRKQLLPVKWGLMGPVGGGEQWLSWISLDDLVRIFVLALNDERVAGAINGVAPNPVRQKEFASTLGRVLHRPAVLPVPGFVVKGVFGEMGKETILSSARIQATRLPAGMTFRYPTLEAAIRHALDA